MVWLQYKDVYNMNSLIFRIWICLLISYTCGMEQYPLIGSSLRSQLLGIRQFGLNYMNFSGSQKLLISHGIISNSTQNQLLQLFPKAGTGSILNITGSKPAGRYNHCSLVYEYKLYIYGGHGQSGQTLSDMWEFNSIFMSWSLISTSPAPVRKCELIRNSTNLVVMGLNAYNQLTIFKYSLVNNNWSKLNYSYGYAIVREGKLWDGSTRQTLTTIENISPNDKLNQSTIRYTSTFTTSSLCVQKNSKTDYTYLIVTDTKILTLNLKTMKINLLRLIQSATNSQQYQCEISDQWLFIIRGANNVIVLDYYSLNDFCTMGSNTNASPQGGSAFQTVIMDNNLYFISQTTLRTWILYKNCESTPYLNIKVCFYGEIHCEEGYRGENCSQPICPNTLSLIDQFNNDEILYQCSNHGTCTANGCLCDQFWTGEDCSTYTRRTCNGQLMENWPVMNCQCEQQTLGGNACEVKFCYNDCSDHGKCLTNGQCICQSGYYGHDCSINIIDFPGATLTL